MAGNKNSGRPEFVPTDDQRETVRVLKAGGMSQEAIAEVVGVSVPTLTKHFSSELDRATAKVRADVLMARYRSAMGGNVSAQNRMLDLVGAVDANEQVRSRRQGAEKAVKLGKKEQAKVDAGKAATGRLAVRQPPRLVADNTR